jgi:hypothetical protein
VKLFPPRMFAAVAVSTMALSIFASPAVAQSGSYGDPYRAVISAAPSSYWGYTYSPYATTPLHGVAAIIHAQGDYLVKRQEAALLREQVRQVKLQTRRLQLEHWEWERNFKVGALNRERKRVREAEVERARNFPPNTEIYAAIPLNNLLDELRKQPALSPARSSPIEASWLAHIHITVEGRGNMGLLKTDRLFWPQLLTRSDFAPTREKIDQLLASSKEQVLRTSNDGRVDPQGLRELRQHVAECKKRIDNELASGVEDTAWNLRHYMEASRFLRDVNDAIYVLEKPNAAMYLNPLQGATVAELVAHMKKKGIRFAPALTGDEQHYIALHRALADEVTRLQEK